MKLFDKFFRKGEQPSDKEREVWLNGEKTYEGFPLFLRRPQVVDYDRLPSVLMVLKHHLAKTKPNGLPEDDYNQTLSAFDHDMIDFLPSLGKGRVVLVETFGHKRTYYAYSGDLADGEELKRFLLDRHPGVKIEVTVKADPSAKFIRRYASEQF